MSPELRERHEADPGRQAAALAGAVAAALDQALRHRPLASLVVSGGNTPGGMYRRLARHALDWSRLVVTLADERWVSTDDKDSNEHMVRATLLRSGAARARFIGLKNGASGPVEGAAAAWAALREMPRPFDAVLLGMGDDGHTASLFPGSPNLAAALDPLAPPGCVAVQPPVAAHARLSLNLAALLQSRRIFVQIIGAHKWQAYAAACADGPPSAMPIRAILRQDAVPVEVHWCPDAAGPDGGERA
jgi:6-phosphogluconolactonase